MRNIFRNGLIITIVILFMGASIFPIISGTYLNNNILKNDNGIASQPLPHWREGGTPYNPNQSLQPFSIHSTNLKDIPMSGLVESPPEYDPTHGVIFWYSSSSWSTVVRDLVVELTENNQYDEIAYVVVTSTSQMNNAIAQFSSAGANMSKVEFIIEPGNSIWIRDYGPHFIWQDGTLGIVDSHYYPSRPLDNFNPTLIGDDHFFIPTYDMGLYFSGGNFQPGPNKSGFVTSLVNSDNPTSAGFNQSFIAELYQEYLGIDSLHIMPQLPSSVDGTGHIDMWMYLIDEDSVIISEFIPGSNPTAIQITNNAVVYMENLGFTVHRTPAWNVGYTHYTYTNGFRVNDRIFIPYYGGGNPAYLDEDAAALASFQASAGPEVEIIPIDCYSIIPAAGAIHCIVMQVPRYIDQEPSAHVIWPNGGELLVSGTTQTISWAATDTYNADIAQIELYYSTDGGNTYNYIDTTINRGSYEWTVPFISTEHAKIKVIVISQDLDQVEDESDDVFQIATADHTIYNFSTGAGVDKFGWGYRTISWSNIDYIRTPVNTEIDTLVGGAYTKIAYSDATGGDTDPNRYISPSPSSSYESTHVYEFTINEDPLEIDDIGILWEGYADDCTQIELYIWDSVMGQWGNGKNHLGQNRYMDNWAGNRDGYLEQHIRSSLENYIDIHGKLTLLLYAERSNDPSFHDYIEIIVSDINESIGLEISNVKASPIIQDVGGYINISCNVSHDSTIEYVNVNVTYPDDTYINQTMFNVVGTDFYFYNITYSNVGIYDFFITASDIESNQDISLTYHFGIGEDIIGIPLSTGWNQITIPVDDNSTASSLGDNITGCILVSYWNNTMDQYQDWIVGWSDPLDNYPILPGRSYFVGVSIDSTFLVEGNSISSVSVPLGVDWNMIGWFNESATTASSLGDNITGCILVSYWNNTMDQYQDWIVGWSEPEDDYAIHQGMGVFVGTNSTSVWYGEG